MLLVLENVDPLVTGRGGEFEGRSNGAKFIGVLGLVGPSIGDADEGDEGRENDRAGRFRDTTIGGGERDGAGGGDDAR